MKKVITLVLCAVMLLTLCACGKSKEAQNVDDLILAIGEVSIDSAEKIAVAEEAYNALSDKDKSTVENFSVLNDAIISLRRAQFDKEYVDLVSRLEDLNDKSQQIFSTTYLIWENSGTDELESRLVCVQAFQTEENVAFLKENLGRSFLGLVVGARSALTGEKLSLDISDSQKEKVIEKCMEYNTLCNSAKDAFKALEEDLKSFGTNYESDFSEEVDNLNSWCIESSLYTEFSMTPSGTMSNYANQNSTYHDNLNRFQKIAESYINDVA